MIGQHLSQAVAEMGCGVPTLTHYANIVFSGASFLRVGRLR